ncbi:hypothetical protein DNTS_004816 [Danionella cerebrum]|uniref:Uncharacterized protein n=1 Tax=Danionella cerebrum TaxID=2873325 RepID=A0A553RBR4_9TELE|nr:hypothetical protein DNTS_004816 [Danionella translucida]
MGVLGWVVALGIILSIAGTIYLVRKQKNHKQGASDSESNGSSPGHKKPSSTKKKTADDFQSPTRFYDELPNTADYVSYRLACNKEDYVEQHSPPLSFLPQHPQHQTTAIFSYPAAPMPGPGQIPPYTFPKEQYV